MLSGLATLRVLCDRVAARLAIEYAAATSPRKHGAREQVMRVVEITAAS
jgi:hypothetical protein